MFEELLDRMNKLDDLFDMSRKLSEDIEKLSVKINLMEGQNIEISDRVDYVSGEILSLTSGKIKAEKRVQSLREQQRAMIKSIENLVSISDEAIFFSEIDLQPARRRWRWLSPLWLARQFWHFWVENSTIVSYTLFVSVFSVTLTYLYLTGFFK